jgi:cell division protein FtsI/penicillin-binding protein 2
VTAERLAQLGPPYRAGDNVGLSGIEAVYEARLAGRPAQDVDIIGRDGATVRSVAHQVGSDPQPVQLTLDAKTQQAAEAALAGVAQPAALVAIDSATGALRAVVSDPPDQAFDRALDGRYPPGSTFKIVTAAALLATGSTAATPAPCPPQLTVGGLRFKNFEGEAPGSIPLHTAFAISCNTAFVGLAAHLPGGALSTAATSFGFGAPVRLPVSAVGGTFPAPADQAEAAAAAIGQAKVTASPMEMAAVAATVASGQWRPPALVLQPAPAPAQGPSVPPLDPAVAAGLRSFMAEVVTAGTGTAAAVPGQPVSGKTGTAEFGSGNPPQTHAWFVGFRGGLSFAVLVEGGGVGGRVAAPLAAKFLAAAPVS